MKRVIDYIWDHCSGIVCRLCGLVWSVMGLACLFAAYRVWGLLAFLRTVQMLGRGMEILIISVIFLSGIVLLLYGVVQCTRGKDISLAVFFRRKIPDRLLFLSAYLILLIILCFFTLGEVSLKTRYAIPVAAASIVLFVLDLSTNLGLFPDQWETSSLIRWIRGRKK